MVTLLKLTLLEKAALDGGFNQQLPGPEGWLAFASPHCSLHIWLTELHDKRFAVALSQAHVDEALTGFGVPLDTELPPGATRARAVPTVAALHDLVKRAFQLSRTLPTALLDVFERKTRDMPTTTEVERLGVQRVGQDLFRQGLLDYWRGRCAIIGLAVPALLRASHIKPWKDCESSGERLDVYNGLLLAAHLDAAFDSGLMTVLDDGSLLWAPALDDEALKVLGVSEGLRLEGLRDGHRKYLPWHREKVFKGALGAAVVAAPQGAPGT
jgi:putative restriction endonuclease